MKMQSNSATSTLPRDVALLPAPYLPYANALDLTAALNFLTKAHAAL